MYLFYLNDVLKIIVNNYSSAEVHFFRVLPHFKSCSVDLYF